MCIHAVLKIKDEIKRRLHCIDIDSDDYTSVFNFERENKFLISTEV